jgi:hypothetical protein
LKYSRGGFVENPAQGAENRRSAADGLRASSYFRAFSLALLENVRQHDRQISKPRYRPTQEINYCRIQWYWALGREATASARHP